MKKITSALCRFALSVAAQFPEWQQRYGLRFTYRNKKYMVVRLDLSKCVSYQIYFDVPGTIYFKYLGSFKPEEVIKHD